MNQARNRAILGSAQTFGRTCASKIRRRPPRFCDNWRLDEVVISINGKMQCHVRAVDADGFVLDALVQSREGRRAAQKLLRKLIRAPRVMVTDKLGSDGAARTGMGMTFDHRQHMGLNHMGLNNRAKNAHLPTRRRKRIMKRIMKQFRSASPPALRLHPRWGRQPPHHSPPRHVVI
jgi:putative transposase